MTFIEKTLNGFYPSKEKLQELNTQNLNREEICKILNISTSTYKKLQKYYNLSPKPRKVNKEDYIQRVKKIEQTLINKYGEKDSQSRKEFYQKNKEKREKTCLQKYGIKNPSSLKEIQDKKKESCLQKYGVDNPMKNIEIQNKARETDLKRYGVEYHINNPEIQKKSRETCLQRYGVEYASQLPEIKDKQAQTNKEKYGYSCCLCNSSIRAKGYSTMSEKGKQAVLFSSQQKYLNDLYQGKLNYLFEFYHVDSYLEKDNIIVEYSGSGHDLSVRLGKETKEHFEGKEKARRNYFRNKKIPILEFLSKTDKLPEDNILLEYLSKAKQKFSEGILYYCVNLDTEKEYYN